MDAADGPRKPRYEKRPGGMAQEEGQYTAVRGNAESGPSDPQMPAMNPREVWASTGCWKPSRMLL